MQLLHVGLQRHSSLLIASSHLPDPGEEGRIVPETYDGKASGLRCAISHLSGHVHRDQ